MFSICHLFLTGSFPRNPQDKTELILAANIEQRKCEFLKISKQPIAQIFKRNQRKTSDIGFPYFPAYTFFYPFRKNLKSN